MFAEFDYSSFPIVNVKINSKVDDDEDFELFLNSWRKLYDDEKNFSFVFDTKDVCWIPLKYSFKMSMFIKELKQRNIQYLQQSTIHVYNTTVMNLLSLIFILQKPVAPVNIIRNNQNVKTFLP